MTIDDGKMFTAVERPAFASDEPMTRMVAMAGVLADVHPPP
jgi:hypothetical protein